MHTFSFEKLEAWKKSRSLTRELYVLTASFPKSEQYGLSNQIRRASVSICSNLAEGSSRRSLKEQNQFYQFSFSSLMEVLNQLILSNDLEFISDEALEDKRESILVNIQTDIFG